jgi:hypothetical protein
MNPPLLDRIPDYQAVFFWEYVRYLEDLHSYALSQTGRMDESILHGFTSRITALRDDLVDELPPDPRTLSPGKRIIRFPNGGPAPDGGRVL